MKSLIVTGRRPELAGGVERFNSSLSQCLEAKGWQVEWLTAQDLTGLESFDSWQELVNVQRIGRRVQKISGHYDLIISSGSWGANLPNTYNRINVYHGTSAGSYRSYPKLSLKNRLGMWINTNLERKSGRFSYNVAVSEKVKEEVRTFYRNEVHVVIENSAGSEFFPITKNEKVKLRRRLNIADDAIVALYAGRIEFRKGTDCFVNVAKRTVKDFPNVFFLIVSPKPVGKWLNDAVHFLHGHDRSIVLTAYQVSDVLFFPSRYEGYEYVTVESLSSGLPVIGGPVGAAAVLRSRDAILGQFVAEKWDEDLFYGNLVKYITLPVEQRQALSKQARQYAEKWSSPQRFCQQWSDAIEEALSLRNSS